MTNAFPKILLMAAIAVGALSVGVPRAEEPDFTQVNLVSDIAGLAAVTDPSLNNPWGVSHSPISPFWSSNQGTGTATLYIVTGKTTVSKAGLTVTIPTTGAGPQGPTGQVNNTNIASFPVGPVGVGDGGSAHFIFANLNGTISAWDAGTKAFIQVTTPGAVYTGLAINGAETRLYAVNTKAGRIDVFDSKFAPVTTLGAGAFVNPSLPKGLVPFNARDIGGDIYVTYAPAGRLNQVSAPLGAGAVAVFDEDGNFIRQLIEGSHLAAPWGITLAPAGFGRFGNHLLVGNFSFKHSQINAFDPTTGGFRGSIPINAGANQPGGLWSIEFGVGGNNGNPDTLYFTDGINGEANGLFGAILPRQGPED
jgi:uncharacterized protein (TIGR03118 family)